MNSDAGGLFYDAGANLEQPQPEDGELGLSERIGDRDGIAKAQHQPVGGGMEDEAHLVGDRSLARGAVGAELHFVHLDQVRATVFLYAALRAAICSARQANRREQVPKYSTADSGG